MHYNHYTKHSMLIMLFIGFLSHNNSSDAHLNNTIPIQQDQILTDFFLKTEIFNVFTIATCFEKKHPAHRTFKKILKKYFGHPMIYNEDILFDKLDHAIHYFIDYAPSSLHYLLLMDIYYIYEYQKDLFKEYSPAFIGKMFSLGFLINSILPSYHLQKKLTDDTDEKITDFTNYIEIINNKLFSDLGILHDNYLYNQFYDYFVKNINNSLLYKQCLIGIGYAYYTVSRITQDNIESICIKEYKKLINHFINNKTSKQRKLFKPLDQYDYTISNILGYSDQVEGNFTNTVYNITDNDKLFNLMILGRISDKKVIKYNAPDKATRKILKTYGFLARFILDELASLYNIPKIPWNKLEPIIISSLRVERILEILALFGNMAPVLHKEFLHKYQQEPNLY